MSLYDKRVGYVSTIDKETKIVYKEQDLKESIKELEEVLDWISKEISIQPTDKGVSHLKNQIIGYIIPIAKEKVNKIVGGKLTK